MPETAAHTNCRAAARPPCATPRPAVVCGVLPVGRRRFAPPCGRLRLLDSALVGLPGVRRLARQRFRRSAFADIHAARALLQQATERASAILTPRQVLALQLYCEGQPMASIAARLGPCAVVSISGPPIGDPPSRAVTREFLALDAGRISLEIT